MLAGFELALNQLLMPPLVSFTSGRLSPRNTSYLRSGRRAFDTEVMLFGRGGLDLRSTWA